MRLFIVLLASAAIAPSYAGATPVTAAPLSTNLAAQTTQRTCVAHSGLLNHAAYRRAVNDDALMRCSQPLSTDTLLTVRQWDHT